LSPQSRIGTNPHALPQFGTKVNAAKFAQSKLKVERFRRQVERLGHPNSFQDLSPRPRGQELGRAKGRNWSLASGLRMIHEPIDHASCSHIRLRPKHIEVSTSTLSILKFKSYAPSVTYRIMRFTLTK